jgi:3-mercaptopyruvate sulfurtransferase SseA
VFVLKLLGYGRAKNYDGSMGEWANREDTLLEV